MAGAPAAVHACSPATTCATAPRPGCTKPSSSRVRSPSTVPSLVTTPSTSRRCIVRPSTDSETVRAGIPSAWIFAAIEESESVSRFTSMVRPPTLMVAGLGIVETPSAAAIAEVMLERRRVAVPPLAVVLAAVPVSTTPSWRRMPESPSVRSIPAAPAASLERTSRCSPLPVERMEAETRDAPVPELAALTLSRMEESVSVATISTPRPLIANSPLIPSAVEALGTTLPLSFSAFARLTTSTL